MTTSLVILWHRSNDDEHLSANGRWRVLKVDGTYDLWSRVRDEGEAMESPSHQWRLRAVKFPSLRAVEEFLS